MNEAAKIVVPVKKPAKTPRKSNHPTAYDFAKVGDPSSLKVKKNDKEKLAAAQLREICAFAKDNKIIKIGRKAFSEKLQTAKDDLKNTEFKVKYPQLSTSVQKMQNIINFYWTQGTMKEVGVHGAEA
jgi:hypothetical protein